MTKSEPSSRSRGVIYIVGGATKYLAEAAHSARSVQEHTPSLPLMLFTTLEVPAAMRSAFDRVVAIEEPIHPLKAKVKYLLQSPYEQTLFLDCDTEVRGDIAPLFQALDAHDFAICHAPHFRYPEGGGTPEFIDYEGPSYNTGVFLFNRSPATDALLQHWYDAVAEQDEDDLWPGHHCDQFHFNELIGEHVAERGLALQTLPNTVWNARTPVIPHLKQDGRLDEVVVYHGRPPLSQSWKWGLYRAGSQLKRALKKQGLVSGSFRLEDLLPRR